MNGKRQPRGARVLFQQQDENDGTPKLTEKELKTEEETTQAPGSPLGVRKNAEREKLIGPTGNAGASAAASRSSLRVSTPAPTAPIGVKATSVGSKPNISIDMDGDTESTGRRLKEVSQHVATPIEAANNADLLRYFKTPKTNEELEDEERKQKRNETLARLGDGIGAFHDAYSYARGVKPMERGNMSEKSRQRYERMRAEWNQDRDSYVNAVLRQQNQRRLEENEASIRRDREERRILREQELKAREEHNAALRAFKEQQRLDAERHKQEEEKRKREETEQKKKESDSRIAKNNRTGGSKSSGGSTSVTYKEDVYDETGKKVGTRTTRTTSKNGARAARGTGGHGKGGSASGGKKPKYGAVNGLRIGK